MINFLNSLDFFKNEMKNYGEYGLKVTAGILSDHTHILDSKADHIDLVKTLHHCYQAHRKPQDTVIIISRKARKNIALNTIIELDV